MSNHVIDTTNQPLVTSLFQEIQKEILSNKIPPNTKLTEQSICKKYGVSRTPVREAFRELEADGLIENIPNRGSFVVGMSARDTSDLFELRSAMEVKVIEWAIKRMDEKEIDDLKETIEFMEFYTLKNDAEKVLFFNSKFHNLLYAGAKNRLLEKTLATYQTYLKHSAPTRQYSEEYLKAILQEHKAIYYAIEAQDIETGKKAMEHHMEQSKARRLPEND